MFFYFIIFIVIFLLLKYLFYNDINHLKSEWSNLTQDLKKNIFYNIEQINIEGLLDITKVTNILNDVKKKNDDSIVLYNLIDDLNEKTTDILKKNTDIDNENSDYRTKIQDLKNKITNYSSNPHTNYHKIKKKFYKNKKKNINISSINLYK